MSISGLSPPAPPTSGTAIQAAKTITAIIHSPRPSITLSSVVRAIYDQTLPSTEVIVVRPGDDHDLDEWRNEASFRVVSPDRLCSSAARNEGLRAATAELVAFFDDDAVPEVNWLEELSNIFAASAHCAACGGTTIDGTRADRPIVFRHGVIAAAGRLDAVRLEAGPGGGRNVLDRANMLCARAALLEVGGFDESFESAWSEYDLCLRLIGAGYNVVHHTRAIVHLLRDRVLRFSSDAVLTTAARDRAYFLRKHADIGDLESARTVLLAGRNQRRVLRRAGVGKAISRRMRRAWYAGVRAALRMPLKKMPANPAREPRHSDLYQSAIKTASRGRQPERWQIALICGVFEAGHNGISEYTRMLAEMFSERGHGVTVFRTCKQPPLETPRAYDVIDVRPRRGELYQAAVGRHVFERHRRTGIDLVEAPIWLGEACGIGLLAPYPVVTRLVTPADVLHRTSGVDFERERANQTSMERLQLGISRGVIGISHAVCRTIEDIFDVRLAQPGRPLSVSPLGLPPLLSPRASFPLPSVGRPVILYVGRLHQRKGILDLGEAFARLADQNREAQLWVLGRDYSDADGFRQRTGKSYVETLRQRWHGRTASQAHLLGELDDTAKNFLISRADVVVVPSWYESFGLVLLEAMRLGKPVVACSAGGMVEIVVDGETGILVPPNDPGRLAAALARLCSDASLRRSMGAAAAARFERLYRLDHCVNRTEEFYADVIESSRRARPFWGPSGFSWST